MRVRTDATAEPEGVLRGADQGGRDEAGGVCGTAQGERDEERDAVEALKRLEFSPRRALELVRGALAREPGLGRGRDAGLLVAEALRAS
ncbi:MAG: hypothetical protein AB7N76_08720 [Planctomycetota bacterium]